ncbi:MAG: three-Cys-motif partner protein TcmP [Bacteroidales bacterium]|nr:three-Cys-motif partner protein TcmP [Bacteroidales bacterium]
MKTKKNWGGRWTEEKLDAFEKYVKAYLTIMNVYRDPYDWKLLYFDGFAGNGSRVEEEVKDALDLFGGAVLADDFRVYQGAAERVVRIENSGTRSFDFFVFVDNNQENCDALKQKLSLFPTVGKKYHLNLDANEAVRKLSGTLRNNSKYKALAFLDPFGMQIDWASIETLKDLSVDLWILVPTGVIINRLLERKVNRRIGLTHAEKLESFFGLSEEVILPFFYTASQMPTLFGDEDTVVTKTENAIRKIAELYIKRLKDVFPFVTDNPLVLLNTQNVPIYHLVFASNKKVAMKIAQDIINKR